MARVVVRGVLFDSDQPCVVHEATLNGETFKAGSLLLAALFDFQDWLDRAHPGKFLYVVQGAYNTGVAASAGTHDKDGCVDVIVIDRNTGQRVWARAQWWLRTHHFYAWLRNSGTWASPSSWHIHMIVVGIQAAGCPVGEFVPGQITDANRGLTGLAGHLRDLARRPKRYTPFPYRRWVEEKEEEMNSPKNWDAEDWAAFDRHAKGASEEGWDKVTSLGRTRSGLLVTIAEKLGIAPKERKQ